MHENPVPVMQNSFMANAKSFKRMPMARTIILAINNNTYIKASVRWVENILGMNDIDELISIIKIQGSI